MFIYITSIYQFLIPSAGRMCESYNCFSELSDCHQEVITHNSRLLPEVLISQPNSQGLDGWS